MSTLRKFVNESSASKSMTIMLYVIWSESNNQTCTSSTFVTTNFPKEMSGNKKVKGAYDAWVCLKTIDSIVTINHSVPRVPEMSYKIYNKRWGILKAY